MNVSRKKITLHEGTVSAYMEKFSYWKNISSIFESEMNENFLLIIIGITREGGGAMSYFHSLLTHSFYLVIFVNRVWHRIGSHVGNLTLGTSHSLWRVAKI